MSYLALYRKYRPTNFDEIVGQRATVTALRNQVKFGQIGHAYLFCGTRGTGKTSTAKVFARAVNCLNPVDGNPCNECELCREAESGFNVIEIDAASNNSVDNIRDLREEVQYTPSAGKYKVYIIDEVHMLSSSAFNALLKTLEEPPEHVIFVLATTDPQKVLPTIVSRCQRYDFKRITTEEIREHLELVCQKEGIEAERDALQYIASIADGGMRDALSILDQCQSYYIHERITLEMVQDVLGAVDDTIFTEMTGALIDGDTTALLKGVEKIFDDGRDGLQFVTSWNGYLRNLLITQVLGEKAGDLLETESGEFRRMVEQATRVDRQRVTKWIEELAKLEAQLRTVSQRRILIEITLIRLVGETGRGGTPMGSATGTAAAAQPSGAQMAEIGRMERRLERVEKALREGTAVQRPTPPDPSQASRDIPQPIATGEGQRGMIPREVPAKAAPQPASEEIRRVIDQWPGIQEAVIDHEPSMRTIQKIRAEAGYEPGVIVLTSEMTIFLEQLSQHPDKIKLIENVIADVTGVRVRVIIGKGQARKGGVSQELINTIHMDVEMR
ncbi:MAG: DNA polymerase III subunit gamma/tau [Firmicutes bacterium]|nr:DNA polymerase III subunit gamma/tau [Bacillota bacterium]